jgi:hypothetical protein
MSGQSFTERAKAKTIQRAEAAMAKSGYPDRVLVGARVQSGPSQYWMLLSSYTAFFRKYYFMGLTERNVVLCGISRWTGRPKNVKSITPREQATISEYMPGTLFDSFRYMAPGRKKPLKIRVGRGYRREVETMIGAVNSSAVPVTGPYQPYPTQFPLQQPPAR